MIVGSMVMHPGEHRDGYILALVSKTRVRGTYSQRPCASGEEFVDYGFRGEQSG